MRKTEGIARAGTMLLTCLLASGSWAQTSLLSLKVSEVAINADGSSQALVSPIDATGNPLRGLQAANFQVSENGQEIKSLSVVRARSNQTPLSVILAVDVSGSMNGVGISSAISGASGFVDRLGKDDFCALETFGSGVQQVVDFTRDHDRLKQALSGLKATDNQTLLYQGLFDALDLAVNAPTNRSVIVLLTDGKDEGSRLGFEDVAAKIGSHDTPVYTLGYGRSVDTTTLDRLAAVSHGKSYRAPQAGDIAGAYLDIAEELENEYLFSWNQPPQSNSPIHLTIALVYRGEIARANLTVSSGAGALVAGPSTPTSARRFRWKWLGSLFAFIVLVGSGIWIYFKWRASQVPALAATMVPPRVWLEIVKGPGQGQKLILFEKDCIIGRDPKSVQILIKNDPMVGRQHARLFEDDQGHYVLEDLNSQNGVMVNGVRISEPVALQSEDKVIVGLTELLFVDQT